MLDFKKAVRGRKLYISLPRKYAESLARLEEEDPGKVGQILGLFSEEGLASSAM